MLRNNAAYIGSQNQRYDSKKLQKLQQLNQQSSTELDEENWAFRIWLKVESDLDDDQLMPVVLRLAKEITAQIDCTTCANCCRVLAPPGTGSARAAISSRESVSRNVYPEMQHSWKQTSSAPSATAW